MTRRRGSWWMATAAGGGASVEDLLNEAAVRFDFSQYTDIENMVDVNGGWGPIVTGFSDVTATEFNEHGLRILGESSFTPAMTVEGTSPAQFGPDGFTALVVHRLVARPSDDTSFYVDVQVNCLFNGDGAPAIYAGWSWSDLIDDETASVTVQDGPPNTNNIVSWGDAWPPLSTSFDATGIFLMFVVVDPENGEVRVRTVSPERDQQRTAPFEYTPADFESSPQFVDYLKWGQSSDWHDEMTMDERVLWNRALTEAEVDALVAHFTA